MRHAGYMYLRPGNLYKDFLVAKGSGGTDGKGRVSTNFDTDAPVLIRAVLAQATPEERARWDQIQHTVTHVIVCTGKPKACENDLLTCGKRKFLVHGVEEAGELGICTIYYAEERHDI
jgi:hypothetical protein